MCGVGGSGRHQLQGTVTGGKVSALASAETARLWAGVGGRCAEGGYLLRFTVCSSAALRS